MASIAIASTSTEVVIHPLVLLSVTDHYNRVAKDTRKRVIGVLLGSRTRNQVDVTNSFAVPFEEDLANPTVWFLDHNFLETMFYMFKKVNSKYCHECYIINLFLVKIIAFLSVFIFYLLFVHLYFIFFLYFF